MLSEPQILALAEPAHRRFVDEMYHLFGLQEHPGYCVAVVKPLISRGGFNYGKDGHSDRITINDALTEKEVPNVSYHETSHFLHPFVRMFYKHTRSIPPRNRTLGEIICVLAPLIFLELSEGLGAHRKYFENTGEPEDHIERLALDIFQSNRGVLQEIIHLDMREARKIIIPLIRRPLYAR